MRVILLNFDYTYVNSVSIRKALKLISKGKVTVERYSEKVIRTVSQDIAVPLVLRLVYFVRRIYRKSVTWSKRNVMIRDGFACVYCGSKKSLSIDHVFPRSKGGKDTFENTVTACKRCNTRKGDKTLKDAQMFFKNTGFRPYQPTIMEFIQKHIDASGVTALLTSVGIY